MPGHFAARRGPQLLGENGQLVRMPRGQPLDEVSTCSCGLAPLDHSQPQPAHDLARVRVKPWHIAPQDLLFQDLPHHVHPVVEQERQERIVGLLA